MYSMLKEIDKYIINNKIPFNRVVFSYDYLPKYINQAILNKLRIISGEYLEFGPDEYELAYDEFGGLFLIVQSSNVRNTMVIYNNCWMNQPNFEFKYFGVSEEDVVRNSLVIESLDKARLNIRRELSNEDMSLFDKRVSEERKFFYVFNNKLTEMVNNDDDMLCIDNNDILKNSTKKITDYIDYLYNYYLDDLFYKSDVDFKNKVKKLEKR